MNDVTCVICLDVFEDPVQLICEHHACKGCLVSMIETYRQQCIAEDGMVGGGGISLLSPTNLSGGGEITCPLCEERSRYTSIDELSTDIVAAQRIPSSSGGERRNSKQGQVTPCDKCESCVANVRCEICVLNLCESCHEGHHVGKWKSHPVFSIDHKHNHQRSTQEQQLTATALRCSTRGHQEATAEYYDADKNVYYCFACSEVARKYIKSPRIFVVQELRDAVLEEIRDAVETLHEQKHLLRQHVLELEIAGHAVREHTLTEVHRLHQYYRSLHLRLEEHEQMITSKLMASRDESIADVREKKLSRIETVRIVNQSLLTSQFMLESSSHDTSKVPISNVLKVREQMADAVVQALQCTTKDSETSLVRLPEVQYHNTTNATSLSR
eukprot:PhF_6_TR5632/c0_g1_i3/m.8192